MDSEDSDQTWRVPRLILVFTGRTGHFVGFEIVIRRLIYVCVTLSFTYRNVYSMLYSLAFDFKHLYKNRRSSLKMLIILKLVVHY